MKEVELKFSSVEEVIAYLTKKSENGNSLNSFSDKYNYPYIFYDLVFSIIKLPFKNVANAVATETHIYSISHDKESDTFYFEIDKMTMGFGLNLKNPFKIVQHIPELLYALHFPGSFKSYTEIIFYVNVAGKDTTWVLKRYEK